MFGGKRKEKTIQLSPEISKIKPEKGDVLLVQFKEQISDESFVSIKKCLKEVFPDNQILILEGEVSLQKVKPEKEDILAICCPNKLSDKEFDRLDQMIEKIFPDSKQIILDNGKYLGTVKPMKRSKNKNG